MENLILEKAREYAIEYNFSVIPLRTDKKPLINWREYQERYPTIEELEQWFKDDKANIGIVTGKISDLAVLDIDGKEGLESLKKYKLELPLTAKVKTGRGYHYYFKYLDGIRNFSKKYPGIDLRGEGGYVVAPPSKHPTGTLYEWERPLSGGIADLPEWITEGVTKKIIERGEAKGEKDRWLEVLQTGVSEGQRNDTLARLAGYFFSQKTSYEATRKILLDWNLKNRPPLSDEEVVRTIDSIYQTDLRKQQTATLEIIDKNFEMTDFFNSQQFVKRHKGKILHCEQWRTWLIYRDGKWCKDRTNEVYALAKETVLEYFRKASEIRDDAERERLVKHAMRSCTVTAIDAMLKLSKPELAVAPEQFDRDDYILNLKDQTLELRKGEVILREQRAEDYLTKQMNVKYNEKATCPKWCDFLEKIFNNNQETIRFIQKSIGYSLTGDTGEDCLFILYGRGANGKTTFLKTITDIFADYAVDTPTETLLSNLSEISNAPTNDIARLAGARLVIASEAQEGRRFNEVLLKKLTGRDKITARFLHQEFFEFEPTFKIFIATNHKPIVKEDSLAFWRRIRLIPFKVTIPEKDRIEKFENILLEEREGIFKWILAGYMAWRKEKLGIPEEVKEATREYKSQMDILADFIEEKCIEDTKAKTATKELYDTYCRWCEENNEKPMAKQTFVRRLEERNYENTRLHGGTRGWKGIGLKKLG